MDYLKSQWQRIQQQLAGLTPSQRMLTGTLVTIMVATLVWWGKYAGTAEMEPVLDQPLSAEDAGHISALLAERHIEYKAAGDRILVSSDRKVEALAVLSYNSALPRDTATGFDEIIKQLSPWDGTDRQNAMFNHGKELTLSRIIGNFPDVAQAAVIIDPQNERHIDRNVEPTAMVTIQMKAGARVGKQLVSAAASTLAGAQSGLAMRNIKVVVNGMPQKVADATPEDGTASADSLRENRDAEEARLTRKVTDLLRDIQGVLVSVTVSVNEKATVSETTNVDQKKSLHVEAYQKSENKDQQNAGPAAGEAGVTPNTGLSLASGAGGGGESNSNSENTEQTHWLNVPAVEHTTSRAAPGATTPVSASVRIPHSWFVNVAKNLSGGKDPDSAAVKQTIEDERAKTSKAVMLAVGLSDPSAVSVDVYADAMPVVDAAPPVSAASSVTMAVGGHAKEILLGALALVSLFMVSAMVKKTGPALPAVIAAAAAPIQAGVLAGGEMIAGEVAEGGNLLNGVELDEESVRTQQVMEQVSTLVDENPDTAATLVKRWLSQG